MDQDSTNQLIKRLLDLRNELDGHIMDEATSDQIYLMRYIPDLDDAIAEIPRLRRELDARTDPELAKRLRDWHAAAVTDCADHDVVLYDDLLTAARLLGGGE